MVTDIYGYERKLCVTFLDIAGVVFVKYSKLANAGTKSRDSSPLSRDLICSPLHTPISLTRDHRCHRSREMDSDAV